MPNQATVENFAKLNAQLTAMQTDNAALRKNIELATTDAQDLAHLRVSEAAARQSLDKIYKAALASSRAESQTGLSNLLASAAALAASRAETQISQNELLASEVLNKALGVANALLVTSEAALAESEARLLAVVDATPECIMLVAPDGMLLQVNQAGLRMMEADASEVAKGGHVLGFIAPEHRQTWRANHERVCRGEALKWDFDLVGLLGTRRQMETHATPLRLLNGQTAQLAISRDVTNQRRTEELQTLLAREVDHRAKNVLAVVLSLLRLTPRDDVAHFTTSIEGRVASMARAHSVLAAEMWVGADLRTVVKGELAAHIGRVSMSGPAVNLKADAVQPMAMVLHELATNATKHGALMSHDGRVELSWDVAGKDGGLRLRWQEFGGPLVQAPPTRRGFGSRLIETLVTRQLSGSVSFDWQEQGLSCAIDLPVRITVHTGLLPSLRGYDTMSTGEQLRKRRASTDDACAKMNAAAPRVFIVEDDAMLAMELEATLGELGYEVIAAGTLAEAVRLAVTEPNLSVAILDVNLGNGEMSFAVVDLLRTRGVPYIFATGYGSAASLDGRDHGAIAVLIKPYPRETLADALSVALRQSSKT